MTGNDIMPPPFRPRLTDIRVAVALLTRLPLPYPVFDATDPRPAAHAAWAYPLVGGVVAMLSGAAIWVLMMLGLPSTIATAGAVICAVLITGAMHEDGLADCADGFWGGWTPVRRLEIMKDSQIGTYGVIALGGCVGLRWAALTALVAVPGWFWTLLGAAVVSRVAMVSVMHLLPPARTNGLSQSTGAVPRSAALLAGLWGLLALALLPAFPLALAMTFVVSVGWMAIARAKIGGQTGDVLGATQQLVELAVLLTCLAAVS